MKRLVLSVTTAAAVAVSALGAGLLAPSAMADGGLTVAIASAGTKKVDVSWADGTALASGPFDAYLVTLDNDADTTPDVADRSRFVDPAATLETRFEDLNANTTYYASVYAVDFTTTGFDVVPATGQPADTPLGTDTGLYTPLTMSASATKVLSGKTITLSGTLTDSTGAALAGRTVTVLRDDYPQFGGAVEETVFTDGAGKWTYTSPALTANTWFWAEFRASDQVGGWTGRIAVEVRKKISIAVAPSTTVPSNTTLKFTGKLLGTNPAYLAGVNVYLQRLQGGTWGSIKAATLDEATGEYSVNFKPSATADGKYRIFSGMGPAYADSWSKAKSITVN